MSYKVRFYKDRQKFSAAHFTLFADGEVERLHGHNYFVEATFHGDRLDGGLLFPFHLVKPELDRLCAAWDEYVLLPSRSDRVYLEESGEQVNARIVTPKVDKRYSFPKQDTALLPVSNISSENLAALFLDRLAARLEALDIRVRAVEVTVSESKGQEVTAIRRFD